MVDIMTYSYLKNVETWILDCRMFDFIHQNTANFVMWVQFLLFLKTTIFF